MIKIVKAIPSKTKGFSSKAWHGVDVAHYGHPVEWKDEKFYFMAEDNGKVVGTIKGKHESGVVYIETIIVDEKERGRGIGKMLIDKAEEFGKKYGAHRTWLITGKDWKENAFYQKLGFKLIASLPDHHFHKDFVIYTRNIK